QQGNDDVFEILRIRCWIRARDTDVRTAAEVNAAYGIDRQRCDMVDVALHQPLKPIAYAHDLHAFERGTNCRGTYHSVNAWSRAAPYQDGQSFVMFHVLMIDRLSANRATKRSIRTSFLGSRFRCDDAEPHDAADDKQPQSSENRVRLCEAADIK